MAQTLQPTQVDRSPPWRAGGPVERDALDRAGMQAPGLVALGAGVGTWWPV